MTMISKLTIEPRFDRQEYGTLKEGIYLERRIVTYFLQLG